MGFVGISFTKLGSNNIKLHAMITLIDFTIYRWIVLTYLDSINHFLALSHMGLGEVFK